jgi:hypothetical protein
MIDARNADTVVHSCCNCTTSRKRTGTASTDLYGAPSISGRVVAACTSDGGGRATHRVDPALFLIATNATRRNTAQHGSSGPSGAASDKLTCPCDGDDRGMRMGGNVEVEGKGKGKRKREGKDESASTRYRAFPCRFVTAVVVVYTIFSASDHPIVPINRMVRCGTVRRF